MFSQIPEVKEVTYCTSRHYHVRSSPPPVSTKQPQRLWLSIAPLTSCLALTNRIPIAVFQFENQKRYMLASYRTYRDYSLFSPKSLNYRSPSPGKLTAQPHRLQGLLKAKERVRDVYKTIRLAKEVIAYSR